MSADDELVTRAKGGDEQAWRDLYVAHGARLRVWLATIPSGDSAATPEDLAAHAWLIAAERISSFNGTGSDFAGWLFGIGRNLAANASRRTARRATEATAELDGTGVLDPLDAAVSGDDWVRQQLGLLSARERQVVTCIDVLGLDVATTATALGIGATAVRVAHHRGLARLRKSGQHARG